MVDARVRKAVVELIVFSPDGGCVRGWQNIMVAKQTLITNPSVRL